MDMKDLKGPSPNSAPRFTIETVKKDGTKSGRKVIVSAIPLVPMAQALVQAKEATSVATRQSVYTSIIVGLIGQYPDAMKQKPDKDSVHGKAIEETETTIFGKDMPRDGLWRMLKSRYLGYYRLFGDVTVEKNGEKFAKPLRVIQTEMDNSKPDPAGDDDRLLKAVEQAIAKGVKRPAIEEAMQKLAAFRDTLLRIEQGEVPEEMQEASDFVVERKAR